VDGFCVRMAFMHRSGELRVCSTPAAYRINGVLVEPFCVIRLIDEKGDQAAQIALKNEELLAVNDVALQKLEQAEFTRSWGKLCCYDAIGELVMHEQNHDGSRRARIDVPEGDRARFACGIREVHRVTGGASAGKQKTSEYEKSFGKVGVR
jgi:hypothetical protein